MPILDLKKEIDSIQIEVEKDITNATCRKKHYIAELIKKALDNYLDFDDMNANNSYSVYKLPIVNESIDMIDFEIRSLAVHVIPTIGKEDNQNVYIPKIYKQHNYKPDMFLFVNFSKNLSQMEIVGFITDITLNTLSVPKSQLQDADSLISTLKTLSPKANKSDINIINTENELMLSYIENALSDEGKQFFLHHIIASFECRKNYKLFYSMNKDFALIVKNGINEFKEDSNENGDSSEAFVEQQTDELEHEAVENSSIEIVTEEFDEIQNDTYAEENIQIREDEESLVSEDLDAVENDIQIHEESEEDVSFIEEEEMIVGANEDSEFSLEEDDDDFEIEEVAQDEFSPDGNTNEQLPPVQEESIVFDESEQIQEIAEADNSENFEMNSVSNEYKEADIQHPEQLGANGNATSDVPVQQANTEESDDIFSFLSELAEDENVEQVPEIEQANQPEPEMMIGNEQDEQNVLNGSELQNISQNEVTEEVNVNVADASFAPKQEQIPTIPAETMQLGANNFDNAFNETLQSQQNVPQMSQQPIYEESAQTTAQTQAVQETNKKKSPNMMVAAAVLVLVCATGFAYLNKDTIMSKIGKTDDQQANSVKVEDVPAPIENSDALPQGVGQELDEPTPPSPNLPNKTTTAKEKEAAIPSVATADTLPNAPATVEPPKPKHLNDAIATALTKDFSGVRISKVSWEVSETLLNNPEVKRYFTISGKSIKTSLSQDLMAATEPSFKEGIVVDIVYKKEGTVSKVQVASSSGSKQIDDIVIKSVKDTLNYVKMPALKLDKPEYTARLIIRL